MLVHSPHDGAPMDRGGNWLPPFFGADLIARECDARANLGPPRTITVPPTNQFDA